VNCTFGSVTKYAYSRVMDEAVPACAMLHFIVMDHDMIGRNDFAGEAFIRVEDVLGFASADGTSPTNSAGKQAALRQFNLLLMHADQSCRGVVCGNMQTSYRRTCGGRVAHTRRRHGRTGVHSAHRQCAIFLTRLGLTFTTTCMLYHPLCCPFIRPQYLCPH